MFAQRVQRPTQNRMGKSAGASSACHYSPNGGGGQIEQKALVLQKCKNGKMYFFRFFLSGVFSGQTTPPDISEKKSTEKRAPK